MTITALLFGALNLIAAVWVFRQGRKRRTTTPQRSGKGWQHYKRQPLVRERPQYIKDRIAAYEAQHRNK